MFHKKTLKILLLTSSLTVVSASHAASLESRVKLLEDKAVTSDKAKISVSGWINRAIQWASNGINSSVSHVSPSNVTSNLQITGMIDPTPGWTVGSQVQIDFAQNGTTGRTSSQSLVDVRRSQSNQQSESALSVRQAEITFDSKSFGKLYMGRGLMASTGVVYYTDMSGTYFFLHPYSSIGGISFRNKATGRPFNENPFSPGSSLKPGISIFEHGDGGSIYGRNDRIRYDSPNFYGFNLCTSHSFQNVGNLFDVALKFAAILANTTVVAQTSWSRNHTQDPYNGVNAATNAPVFAAAAAAGQAPNPDNFKGPKFDTMNGAIGVLTPFSWSGKPGNGLNFHFSGARRKWKVANQEDGRALQGKIGYLDEFFSIGKTAFITSYGQWKGMDVDFFNPSNTMIGTNAGVGIVQTIDAVGTSLYLRYDNYKLKSKNSGARFHDVNIVYVGALVKL